jgi:hypothetical protein
LHVGGLWDLFHVLEVPKAASDESSYNELLREMEGNIRLANYYLETVPEEGGEERGDPKEFLKETLKHKNILSCLRITVHHNEIKIWREGMVTYKF